MHCIHCGKNIPSDSRFCQFCGKTIPTELLKSIPTHDKTQCDACAAVAPTRYTKFHANIGMLLARRQICIKGKLCKNCTNKYFWKYTLINFFLGWWGVVSFFATIIFILSNTFRYLSAIRLKKYY